jgi:hypothetical protein
MDMSQENTIVLDGGIGTRDKDKIEYQEYMNNFCF